MGEFVLTAEKVEAFLAWKASKGGSKATVERYGYDLKSLYEWLPESKTINGDTLSEWKKSLQLEGFSARTVNSRISAVNSFLAFAGSRQLQLHSFGEEPAKEDIEGLTRDEYCRLLRAARKRQDRRLYLLIKTVGIMGLSVQSIPAVTAEAAAQGEVETRDGVVQIPAGLQQELRDYAAERGIESGSVFLTRSGKLLNRKLVTALMKNLAEDAEVAAEKISPRNLRKMKQTTCEEILQSLMAQAEAMYAELLAAEEKEAGWNTQQKTEQVCVMKQK